TARGPLTDAARAALALDLPDVLLIEAGERLAIHAFDSSATSLGVWTDPWKARKLERELIDRVMDAAEARRGAAEPGGGALERRRREELDRTVRAHVLVAWSRHSGKLLMAALGLAALLGFHPLGDGEWGRGELLVGGIAALIVLDRLVHRWYRR